MKKIAIVLTAILLLAAQARLWAHSSHHASSHSHSHYHSHRHYSHRRSNAHKPGGRAGHSQHWCYDSQHRRKPCKSLKGATK